MPWPSDPCVTSKPSYEQLAHELCASQLECTKAQLRVKELELETSVNQFALQSRAEITCENCGASLEVVGYDEEQISNMVTAFIDDHYHCR